MPTERRPRGRPKGFDSDPAQVVNQSLDRAIDLLATLAAGGAMTLSQLSVAMGQSSATLYRLLTTFQLREMVEVDPMTQAWSVGPATFRLGAAFLRRSDVVDRARPAMRRLMEETGETSNLGIERGHQVLFVSQVETHESIRAFFPPGTLSPLHASGIGKALLAHLPQDRLARLLATGPLERFTGRTLTDPGTLMSELERIRTQGFAFDDEEKAEGMRCIAAPILNIHGEAVAGISISGPSNRISRERADLIGAIVREAAQDVSRRLGAPVSQ
jgi:IclR family acetate operon transcriptional repressor